MVKLYDRKIALTIADALDDRVLPFFEQHGIPLLCILSDQGTEYNGKREHHEFELYLTLEGIDHSQTKARHPQTNGICEGFHRTIQNEFYAIVFKKLPYKSIEKFQVDLDEWILEYNCERTNSGKFRFGKTLMETFLDSIRLAEEKMLSKHALS